VGQPGPPGPTGFADLNINMVSFSGFLYGNNDAPGGGTSDPSGTWSVNLFSGWTAITLREQEFWIYPGIGAAESNPAFPQARYWRTAQPVWKGQWSVFGQSPYMVSPPSISLPWTYSRITEFSYGFGQGISGGPPFYGWNQSQTMAGWNVQIYVYCETDSSGSNPAKPNAHRGVIPRDRSCGCVKIDPPLDVRCHKSFVKNTISVSVTPLPVLSPGWTTTTIPEKNGFISIGLKYEIVEF
jgi:hypothetical protein